MIRSTLTDSHGRRSQSCRLPQWSMYRLQCAVWDRIFQWDAPWDNCDSSRETDWRYRTVWESNVHRFSNQRKVTGALSRPGNEPFGYCDNFKVSQEDLSAHFQVACQPILVFFTCFKLIAFYAEWTDRFRMCDSDRGSMWIIHGQTKRERKGRWPFMEVQVSTARYNVDANIPDTLLREQTELPLI